MLVFTPSCGKTQNRLLVAAMPELVSVIAEHLALAFDVVEHAASGGVSCPSSRAFASSDNPRSATAFDQVSYGTVRVLPIGRAHIGREQNVGFLMRTDELNNRVLYFGPCRIVEQQMSICSETAIPVSDVS